MGAARKKDHCLSVLGYTHFDYDVTAYVVQFLTKNCTSIFHSLQDSLLTILHFF